MRTIMYIPERALLARALPVAGYSSSAVPDKGNRSYSDATSFPSLSLSERDRRWGRVREFMSVQDLDGIIAFGERDGSGPPQFGPDVYLTNDRPGAIVWFSRDGEPVALVWSTNVIGDHIEAVRRGDPVWMMPHQMRIGKTAAKLTEEISRHGLQNGRLGVLGIEPFGPFHPEGLFPAATWAHLQELLPEATLIPCWRAFAELMLIKSAEEVSCLAKSAQAGDSMCQAMLEVARVGISEADLVAAATSACFSAGATSYWLILSTGKGNVGWGAPAWTYRAQPPRVVENGDVVLAELFVLYGSLETQQQLTIAVGDVSPQIEAAAQGAMAAYRTGLDVLRPGVRFGDVAAQMHRPVEHAGGWNLTPHIHTVNPLEAFGAFGFGINLPEAAEYGLSATRQPTRRPELIIEEGMSFAFEPNCGIGRDRVNIGGTVVLTPGGCLELNQVPNRPYYL